jgi:hypothetical protein
LAGGGVFGVALGGGGGGGGAEIEIEIGIETGASTGAEGRVGSLGLGGSP